MRRATPLRHVRAPHARAAFRRAPGVALLLAAAGCSTTGTGVDKRMILPDQAPRYAPDPRDTFLMAAPIDHRLPVFPTAAGRGTDPVPVCVDFVVTAEGAVEAPAIVHAPTPPCAAPTPGAAPFEAAVLDAVSHWSFFGAGVCTFPPGVAKNDDCDGVEVRAVPIRLRYVFTFETRTRSVRAQRAAHRP